MSIAIHATLLAGGRGFARVDNGRNAIGNATLRTLVQTPVDIIIDRLSRRGCRVATGVALPVDQAVTVGLPGIGARAAYVSRSGNGNIGLRFRQALTSRDINAAQQGAMVDGGEGQPVRKPDTETAIGTLSPRARLALMVATGLLGWCLAIIVFRLVIGLL